VRRNGFGVASMGSALPQWVRRCLNGFAPTPVSASDPAMNPVSLTAGPSQSTELMDRARAGEATALDTLLGQHQGTLLRFCLGMCRNSADAEEVLQESLLAAARSIGDFRGDSSVTSWLYAIARSFCIKQQRGLAARARRSATVGTDAALAVKDEGPAPDQAASDRELAGAMQRALDALPVDYREVLLLRDVEGFTAPEVAETLSLNVPQVKSRLHRARAALRAELAPLFAELNEQPRDTGCPDIAETFSHYLEGDISGELCDRMQAHVAGCAQCSNTCDSLKRTLALCNAVPTPSVPPSIQDAVRAEVRKLARS